MTSASRRHPSTATLRPWPPNATGSPRGCCRARSSPPLGQARDATRRAGTGNRLPSAADVPAGAAEQRAEAPIESELFRRWPMKSSTVHWPCPAPAAGHVPAAGGRGSRCQWGEQQQCVDVGTSTPSLNRSTAKTTRISPASKSRSTCARSSAGVECDCNRCEPGLVELASHEFGVRNAHTESQSSHRTRIADLPDLFEDSSNPYVIGGQHIRERVDVVARPRAKESHVNQDRRGCRSTRRERGIAGQSRPTPEVPLQCDHRRI